MTTQLRHPKETEAFFRALGWKKNSAGIWTYPVEGLVNRDYGFQLPNITESMSAFNEHVAKVMEEDGYKIEIVLPYLYWINRETDGMRHIKAEITKGEILLAAVVAATRYLEGKE